MVLFGTSFFHFLLPHFDPSENPNASTITIYPASSHFSPFWSKSYYLSYSIAVTFFLVSLLLLPYSCSIQDYELCRVSLLKHKSNLVSPLLKYSTAGTPTHLLFLQYTMHTPVSGPLHLLFSLPDLL